jgi:hypothetical protein
MKKILEVRCTGCQKYIPSDRMLKLVRRELGPPEKFTVGDCEVGFFCPECNYFHFCYYLSNRILEEQLTLPADPSAFSTWRVGYTRIFSEEQNRIKELSCP